MKNFVLRGDASLLERIACISLKDYSLSHLRAAFCWDHYGLPDGTRNPTGIGKWKNGSVPDSVIQAYDELLDAVEPERDRDSIARGHVLMPPHVDLINEAFNKVLDSLLHDDEKWLMAIPRGVANLGALDAQAYCTSSGSVAMVLPYAAFGGLFYVNELYHELNAGQEGLLTSESRSFIENNLHILFSHWILCMSEPSSKSEEIGNLEFDLEIFRWIRKPRDRYWIWATTVSQQVFLLLHEFGHLTQVDPANKEKVSDDLYELKYRGIDEELKADKWAGERMRHGIPKVFEGNFQWSDQAVFVLFGIMEVLRCYKYLTVSSNDIVERAYQLKKFWDPILGPGLPKQSIEMILRDFEDFFLQSREA
jgi:hypothetical protein